MKLAKALAKARQARKLSQAQLAKLIGVSAGTVAGWETDRHGIRVKRLRAVAKVLDWPELAELAELVA